MTKSKYLIVSNEQIREIRSKVNVTEDQIKKDVADILQWFEKQQHLPRIELDQDIIEQILVSRKGSLEQTKQKIDMMFTLRNMIPELNAVRDIRHPKMDNVFKACNLYTLPKLNKDHTRVSGIQYKDPKYFSMVDIANCMCLISEYLLYTDYSSGMRYIQDLSDVTMSHVIQINPAVMKNVEVFVRKAFGMRIFGIHIINGSSMVNKVIAIFKSAFSEKIASRIYVHETYEDLYKVLDKDILPKEYGGNEKSIPELIVDYKEELARDGIRDYLVKQETLKSNEKLRIGAKYDEDILGLAGSFKKIEVD